MEKKQCVKVLKSQKSKLKENFNSGEYSIWHGETLYYLEKIFNKDSYPYNSIIPFKTYDIQHASKENYLKIRENLNNLIDSFIGMVQSDSYEKQPKVNFLNSFNNGALTTILLFVIGGIGTGCFLFGNYTAEVKNFDLIQKNKSLKDSVLFYENNHSHAPIQLPKK